jgi:hypothetical protein
MFLWAERLEIDCAGTPVELEVDILACITRVIGCGMMST